jgi:sulfur transfer protein SufE
MKDQLGIAFSEASTWRGLVLIITALGVQLDPEQIDAIIAAGLALSGLIGVFWKRYA